MKENPISKLSRSLALLCGLGVDTFLTTKSTVLAAALPGLLCLLRLGQVVEELHRLRVEVQLLEEVGEQLLVELEQVERVGVEVDPDLDPVVGLAILRRNEAEPADVLAVGEVLAQQEEDQLLVELVLVLLRLGDGEDEPPASRVAGVLPLGLDALLEVLDGVDLPPLLLYEVAG